MPVVRGEKERGRRRYLKDAKSVLQGRLATNLEMAVPARLRLHSRGIWMRFAFRFFFCLMRPFFEFRIFEWATSFREAVTSLVARCVSSTDLVFPRRLSSALASMPAFCVSENALVGAAGGRSLSTFVCALLAPGAGDFVCCCSS